MSLFQRQKIHLLSLLPARMTMEMTIQVLQNYKRDGWALSDTIDEALKHARKEKTKFLLRADVKEKLKEYADLLLGAHS
jgi:low affinity Fe/Cu permease